MGIYQLIMDLVDEIFDRLDSAFGSGGPAAAFDTLTASLQASKQYAHLFEARLMRKRHELGLPLHGETVNIPAGQRAEWDSHVSAAAREAGEAFLAEGDVARAWPYYRALGEPAPVKAAIEKMDTADAKDEVIDVALYERVHPERGYAMVLATHGSCRAITCLDQYPDADSRDTALALLARALHKELTESLARAIEKQEGAPPPDRSMTALLAGRDWLFGEYDYYIDTSHLLSALRFAVESNNPEVWRLALDFAEYGAKLGPMFHYAGEPPFEKPFVDHAMFLRGLLGIDADASVAHFRHIAATADPERIGTYPAQVLVRYLLRLKRPQEAIEVFERHLTESDPQYLTCPNLTQLCQLAGDNERLRQVARGRSDVLSYLAGYLLKPAP
jgi:tetratricopeptide (TPR) repeat protein